jgi:CRISPR-associated protein Cmr5
MNIRTQAQERMLHAMTAVDSVFKAEGKVDKKTAKSYGALVKSAPADIQTNGLAQALAFWRAKGKPEHELLVEHINVWLKKWLNLTQDVHLWIAHSDTSSAQYLRAMLEAMNYVVWLKRFAEAAGDGR